MDVWLFARWRYKQGEMQVHFEKQLESVHQINGGRLVRGVRAYFLDWP